MFKATAKLFIALLLSGLLISSNALAFHKINFEETTVYEDVDLEREQVKQKYCALKVKKKTNKDSTEQATNDEGKVGWFITGSHYLIKIPAGKKLLIGTQKKQPLKKKIDHETSLEDVLKIHCLQYEEENRPTKYSKSSMEELFLQIAEKNNLLGEDGTPSIKKPIGRDIYDAGLIIDIPTVVYYIPDYLIASYGKHLEKKEKQKTKEKKKKKKAAKDKKWVKENYSIILNEAEKKIKKFKESQEKLTNEIKKLAEEYKKFEENLNDLETDIDNTITFDIINKDNRDIIEILKQLNELRNGEFNDIQISTLTLESDIQKDTELIKKLFNKKYTKIKSKLLNQLRNDYSNLSAAIDNINDSISKNQLTNFNKYVEDASLKNLKQISSKINESISNYDKLIKEGYKTIEKASDLINNANELDAELSEESWLVDIIKLIGLIVIILLAIGGVVYLILQNRKISELKSDSRASDSKFSKLQGQITETAEQVRSSRSRGDREIDRTVLPPKTEKLKTPEEIIKSKYEEVTSDYKEALEDFSKVAEFKQKWNGLALSRKERQDGTKTILINSTRPFEKAGIWCVNFSETYFAFPGSSVKSNMATYMNMDFMKAGQDFKGIFSISEGSSYSTEPAVIRRGGAGFVVERVGKLVFPN